MSGETTLKKRIRTAAIMMALSILLCPLLQAAEKGEAQQGFEAVAESAALKAFLARPVTEHSKLLYLIDRFEHADIQIVYAGHYFDASAASRVARWFLARRYKDETVHKWVMQWCNTSIPSGELIWVKFGNGKFKLAREVLFDELKKLEAEASRSFLDQKIEASKDSSAKSMPTELSSGPMNALAVPAAKAAN